MVVAIPPALMNENSLWCAGHIWQIYISSSVVFGFLCSSMQTPEPHSVQKDTTRPDNGRFFQTKLNFSTEHMAEQVDSNMLQATVPAQHQPKHQARYSFFVINKGSQRFDNPTRSLLSIKMVSGTGQPLTDGARRSRSLLDALTIVATSFRSGCCEQLRKCRAELRLLLVRLLFFFFFFFGGLLHVLVALFRFRDDLLGILSLGRFGVLFLSVSSQH